MRRRTANANLIFMGRLEDDNGRAPRGPLVVRVLLGEKELDRRPVAGDGRFLIPPLGDNLAGQALTLTVLHVPSKETVGTFVITHPPAGEIARETLVLRRRPARRARDLPPTAPPRAAREVVARNWREAVTTLLAGRVPARDGRPLVPAAVNTAIADLNDASYLARQVLAGDMGAADKLLGEIGMWRGGAAGTPSMGLGPGRRDFMRGDRLPCIFGPGGGLDVALAGLALDVYRAEVLGDLTQPGAYTQAAAGFLHDRYGTLHGFGEAAADFAAGALTPEGFNKRVFGQPGDPLGDPLGEPLLTPTPRPGGSGPDLPGLTPGDPRGGPLPCDDLGWVDCVEGIEEVARNYRPPARCVDEEDIGSITPGAICLGATGVELEIRPRPGRQFGGDGASCRVYIQRHKEGVPLINRKKQLPLVSYTADLIKVTLDTAEWSGCLGVRGGGGAGGGGNIGFVRSCLKAGRIHSPVLEGLLAPQIGSLRQIQCTGDNVLQVVPPPRLDSLAAVGPGGSQSQSSTGDLYLTAEACRNVTLSWLFSLDDPLVDADDFVRVSVTDEAGNVVDSDLPPDGALIVNEQAAQGYTITAVVVINGTECGRAAGTATIDRVEMLSLAGTEEIQTGTTATVTVESSCRAPAGGRIINLSSSDSGRLGVPDKVTIPEGEVAVSFDVTGVGSGCGSATITANSAGHSGATFSVHVYDTPVITQLSPNTLTSCGAFTLTLTGSCFEADDLLVRARQPGVFNPDLAWELLPSGQIRVTGADIPAGSWNVEVRSHGLWSNAAALQVSQTNPTIELFSVLVAGQIIDGDTVYASPMIMPGIPNWLEIGFVVHDAARVVVLMDGDPICDAPDDNAECGDLPGCGGPYTGHFTALVDESVTLTLEAYPVGGGNPITREVTVGEVGIHELTLQNSSGKDLVIWVYDAALIFADVVSPQAAKHDLPDQGEITLTFSDGEIKDVAQVDKQAAIDEGYDPFDDAFEIAHLASVIIHDVIGSDDGDEVTVGIF